ncbi:MAG: glycosyltransferase [Bacteroidales bacterium]|nr:glycosyltransferase [Bacteroidales bacterium]MCF8334864.1 glycosyltransferase [Bacteroidales bacterium]
MPVYIIALMALLGITFIIQMGYLWGLLSRFAFHRKSRGSSGRRPPVSVVISAHNEYGNLRKHLPKILEQQYPVFEVVVVNDFSEDDTASLLEEFQKKYKHLRVFSLKQKLNFFSGKKFPLSLGIKATSYEHLLLTDADCEPASPYWINEMMKGFDEGGELVLGYGAYRKRKGWLNKLIRFDTLKTALQYFSHALAGKPYMGVGRNLAYLKSVFYRSGGFVSHYKISSGDDDLFVNKVANSQNTRIVYSPESHTLSEAKTSLKDWFTQKKRHAGAGYYYKKRDKILLGGDALSRVLFYISLIILLIILPLDWKLYSVGALLILYVSSQIIIFQKAARNLNEGKLGWMAPLFELFFVIWKTLTTLISALSRKNTWK